LVFSGVSKGKGVQDFAWNGQKREGKGTRFSAPLREKGQKRRENRRGGKKSNKGMDGK